MNYFEDHIGDYAAATAHLSWDEDMAYTRLIRAYYHHEKPIPADLKQACRLARAQTANQREAVKTVLEEFFTLRDDGWHQKRCDAEIARYQDKQEKARRSANARWKASEAQTEGNADASANAMRTHTEGNAPRHQTPDTIEEISNLPVAPARPPSEALGDSALTPPTPPKGPPACPHLGVLALWAEVLPALPQHLPSQWKGARADHLRARWRETATEKGWTEPEQGLAFFRKLFGYVGQSRFLTGHAPQRDPSKRPFVIELEWLVNPTNWAKVIEGKYHQDEAP